MARYWQPPINRSYARPTSPPSDVDALIAEHFAQGGEVTKLPMQTPRTDHNWRYNARLAQNGKTPTRYKNSKPRYEAWSYRVNGQKARY